MNVAHGLNIWSSSFRACHNSVFSEDSAELVTVLLHMGRKILATGVSYMISCGWSSSTMGFCASWLQWVCDVVSTIRMSIKAYQVCVMSPVAINMGVKWILALWKMCDMLGIFSHSFYLGRKGLWLLWPECSSATFLLKEAMIPRVYIWNSTSFVPDCGNVTLQISVYT